MEGVDFKGALKLLAEKAGVEITQMRPEDKLASDKRDRVREAMAQSEVFFADSLTPETPGYIYAIDRGLTSETIKTWKVGLAPTGWRGLLEAFSTRGYTAKELQLAGLVKEADEKPGTWYDRFRNRLMFPIHDIAGRTVAFTGRALDPADQAKYLNSPETELYKKGEVLFGMDKAKDSIRAQDSPTLLRFRELRFQAHTSVSLNAMQIISCSVLTVTALGSQRAPRTRMRRFAPACASKPCVFRMLKTPLI